MESKPQLDAFGVIRVLMGIFLCLLGVWLAIQLIFPGQSKNPGEEPSPFVFILNTFSFQIITVCFVAVFLKQNQIRWRDLFGFLNSSLLRIILCGVIGFIVFVPLGIELQYLTVLFIKALAGSSAPVESQVVVQILQNNPPLSYLILIAISTIILAPIAEEILFRGLLYKTLKDSGHPLIAIYGVSLLFGVIHNNLVAALPLAFFGIILTIVYEITGNLLTPILTHSLFNLMNFIMLMYNYNFESLFKRVSE